MGNNTINDNKSRKKLLFWLFVFAIILITTCFIIIEIKLTTPTPKTVNQNETKNELPNKNLNLELLTLASYPLNQSPLFQELNENCLKDYEALKDNWDYNKHLVLDYQIRNEKSDIIVDSLKKIINKIDEKYIYSDQNVYAACNTTEQFSIFSAPKNGTHIYIEKFHMSANGQYNPGFDGLYSLDLSNLTVKKLFAGNLLRQGYPSSQNYQILKDGKRIVKWNDDSVYLINLEQDSFKYLFVADDHKGDWLVSKIGSSMGQVFYYDVKLTSNEIEVGIFSGQHDKNENPIRITNNYVSVISKDWHDNDTVEPKFINKITIPIPD